jgi:hypothetical protein
MRHERWVVFYKANECVMATNPTIFVVLDSLRNSKNS